MIVKILNENQIAEEIVKKIILLTKSKNDCVLGLATGSSPLGVYKNLISAYKQGKINCKNITTFNLDEYVGLSENHEQSYKTFMSNNLFNGLNINKENTNFPSDNKKSKNYFKNYDKNINKKGGIDLQILGIGSNGHIAFNEPNTSFDSLTHVTKLTESTIKDNSRFFKNINEVPTKAITMGLKSILKAKEIVLIALGKNKQKAIYELVNGEVTENLPASILKRHNKVTIYCDEDAGALL